MRTPAVGEEAAGRSRFSVPPDRKLEMVDCAGE